MKRELTLSGFRGRVSEIRFVLDHRVYESIGKSLNAFWRFFWLAVVLVSCQEKKTFFSVLQH